MWLCFIFDMAGLDSVMMIKAFHTPFDKQHLACRKTNLKNDTAEKALYITFELGNNSYHRSLLVVVKTKTRL